jgi:hypothetical protein
MFIVGRYSRSEVNHIVGPLGETQQLIVPTGDPETAI